MRRGARIIIINGTYEGHRGNVEANVYQRNVDYPEEWANGYHIMLDTEELVTVRCDQVETGPERIRYYNISELLNGLACDGEGLSSLSLFSVRQREPR